MPRGVLQTIHQLSLPIYRLNEGLLPKTPPRLQAAWTCMRQPRAFQAGVPLPSIPEDDWQI